MTAEQWKTGRRLAGLRQVDAARALGLSQPYLSQLETGTRVAGPELARKAKALYNLPATALPLEGEVPRQELEDRLAGLGYPGFAHVASAAESNPTEVVLGAVVQPDLDTRLVEALPWVLSTYTDLNWPWLRDRAKLRNAQNRLGYVVHLARHVVAEDEKAQVLTRWERELEEARLAGEGTLCRDSMPERERAWLRVNRPDAAAHWNLLTSLSPEQLPYARD